MPVNIKDVQCMSYKPIPDDDGFRPIDRSESRTRCPLLLDELPSIDEYRQSLV